MFKSLAFWRARFLRTDRSINIKILKIYDHTKVCTFNKARLESGLIYDKQVWKPVLLHG